MRILNDKCNKCGSTDIAGKSKVSFYFVIWVFITAGMCLLILPFLARRYRCKKCGHIWKACK